MTAVRSFFEKTPTEEFVSAWAQNLAAFALHDCRKTRHCRTICTTSISAHRNDLKSGAG